MAIGDGQPASIEEEIILMIQEGFEHIYKVLDELRAATCRPHTANVDHYWDVDRELIEFRQWLDAPPKDSDD